MLPTFIASDLLLQLCVWVMLCDHAAFTFLSYNSCLFLHVFIVGNVSIGPNFGISGERYPSQLKKLTEVLEDSNVRCCLIDRLSVVQRYSSAKSSCIKVDSDQEAIANACKRVKNPAEQFLWVQLQDLGRFYSER